MKSLTNTLLGAFVILSLSFLLSSCGDGGQSHTQSGSVKNSIPSPEALASNSSDTPLIEKRSASKLPECEMSFGNDASGYVPYIDAKLHKLLGRCDSVDKYYAYSGYAESTSTLTSWMQSWCSDEHASGTTVIDSDEKQCHSGTGAYNVAAVGYVNKYADLVAVFNSDTSGQSKSLWGTNHYCGSGRIEGRSYPGLSVSSCAGGGGGGGISGRWDGSWTSSSGQRGALSGTFSRRTLQRIRRSWTFARRQACRSHASRRPCGTARW